VQVPEHGAGLLWVDGKVERLLTPGSYAFWKFNRNVSVDLVDLRLQAVEVTGQEILTRDKVNLRLNLSATWRYTDVRRACTQLQKPAEHLYRELQFGLRAAVGTRSLDELLGRVEMWRGGGRSGLSVAAPFVWRCPSNLAVAPFPHPPHRTGRALLTHPAPFRHIKPSRSSGRVQAAAGVSASTSRRGTGRSTGGTPFPACRCAFATRPAVAAPCRSRCRGRSAPPAPD
jgi:hypothetical protein